jgi:hypothetical protein
MPFFEESGQRADRVERANVTAALAWAGLGLALGALLWRLWLVTLAGTVLYVVAASAHHHQIQLEREEWRWLHEHWQRSSETPWS